MPARRTKHSRGLEQALDDAAQSSLEVHEAKLIQERIRALSKLVEREHDAAVARLTIEVTALKAELNRVADSKGTQPIESLKEIKALVQKNRGGETHVIR